MSRDETTMLYHYVTGCALKETVSTFVCSLFVDIHDVFWNCPFVHRYTRYFLKSTLKLFTFTLNKLHLPNIIKIHCFLCYLKKLYNFCSTFLEISCDITNCSRFDVPFEYVPLKREEWKARNEKQYVPTPSFLKVYTPKFKSEIDIEMIINLLVLNSFQQNKIRCESRNDTICNTVCFSVEIGQENS